MVGLGAATATVVALAAAGVWLTRDDDAPVLRERCRATVAGESTSMSPEQAGNAATVVGISVLRGLPARAATIGIATVVQESGLRNLDHGDRDSLGLFQQRPSQDWGTPEQVQDPVYATNAFYDALVEVDGYRDLEVTVAAQRVQRSAFPEAYGDHEAEARLVASALTGWTPAGFTCRLREPEALGALGDDATPSLRAQRVREAVAQQVSAVEPQLVAGENGLVLEYALGDGEEAVRLAWALGGWAVASAEGYGVTEVAVGSSAWVRADGGDWADAAEPLPAGTVRVRVSA
ncbi:hypothetical protein [Kineococcus terrestris]|uniref:hypothetical protein n=1 Tax=Kineococcus terrestris TaxID=2044856 RepID=UPI0034DB5FCC